jgi:molybdopterin/thiamine biosynthesis adenylyltransferase
MIDFSRLSFLGAGGLGRLAETDVVVVGAGGGGSHLVQQLAHLAVKRITVIDPDNLENSNVNRVVGTDYDDVGQSKASLLARRFGALGSQIVPLVDTVESGNGIAALQRSDLCIAAVDGFGTRHIIEYFCRMAHVPLIDIGMQITVRDGRPISAGGQIVTSLPGDLCFWCLEFLTDARLALERQEYAPRGTAFAQQVISVNGLLASQAVINALAIITGFLGKSSVSKYLVYNALRHTLSEEMIVSLKAGVTCEHYPLSRAGWFAR